MALLVARNGGRAVHQSAHALDLVRHRPITVAVLVTAAYAAYVVWRIGALGGDPSMFVLAGPPFVDPAQTAPNLHVNGPNTIYDGMFFYRFAVDPWSNAERVAGVQLDQPAYRQQRVFYPIVAWVLSAGKWQFTPSALILANLLAVGVLAYSSAAYAATLGRNVFAAIMVPFYPGYLVTISRDLAELTEAALLVSALVLMQRRRFILAATALVGGMLAKETLLVVPLAGVLIWGINRVRGRRQAGVPLWVWVAPVMAYVIWFAILSERWGVRGLGQGATGNFAAPFVALAQQLAIVFGRAPAAQLEIAELVLVSATVIACFAIYRGTIFTAGVLPLSFAIYFVAAVFYSTYIWQDDYAYLRAVHELFLCAALSLIAAATWFTRGLALSTVVLWFSSAVQRGFNP